jgi:hypothetical protein
VGASASQPHTVGLLGTSHGDVTNAPQGRCHHDPRQRANDETSARSWNALTLDPEEVAIVQELLNIAPMIFEIEPHFDSGRHRLRKTLRLIGSLMTVLVFVLTLGTAWITIKQRNLNMPGR